MIVLWLLAAVVFLPIIAFSIMYALFSNSKGKVARVKSARRTGTPTATTAKKKGDLGWTGPLAWTFVVLGVMVIIYLGITIYSAIFGQTDPPAQSRVQCMAGSAAEMRFCSLNSEGSLYFRADEIPANWSLCHDPDEAVGVEKHVNASGTLVFRFYPKWRLALDERVVVRYQFMPTCPRVLPEH